MSRNNSEAGSFIFIAIIAILIAIPFVPIAWGIYALIKLYKWKKEKKLYPNKTISDFWLSSSDKKGFINFTDNFTSSSKKINELWGIVESENLSLNNDGTLSRRSNRGKELSREIDELETIKSDSLSNLSYLEESPTYKWENLKDNFELYYGSIYAFLFWFIAFYYSMVYFFKTPLLAVFKLYDKFFLNKENDFITLDKNAVSYLVYTLAISALVSILMYYISKFLGGVFLFEKKYPKPPKVTYNNCNNY